jgi:hypothetical protein
MQTHKNTSIIKTKINYVLNVILKLCEHVYTGEWFLIRNRSLKYLLEKFIIS